MGPVRLGRLLKFKTGKGVLGCLDLPESSLKDIVKATGKTLKVFLREVFKKRSGEEGFEPSNGETKTRCLTAWRLPNKESMKNGL